MNISVIGGDLRIIELAKLFDKNGDNVCLLGFENLEEKILENSKITKITTLNNSVKTADLVITSIPISKDGKYINSPYSNEKIVVKELFELTKNKKIITGNVTEKIQECINKNNNNEIIDILKLEELAIKNSIPTAEGAIQIAMEKSLITIHNSNCLILGFGRIGKILAKMLKGMGANVYCEARKQQDLAWIETCGYSKIDLKNLNNELEKIEFDFIFNTIPSLILDEKNLKFINKQCIIIDLASKPGGVDFEEANKLGLVTNWALALPGKVAPKTAAKYIFETIKNNFDLL